MQLQQRLNEIVSSGQQLINLLYPHFDLKIYYITIFAQSDGDYDDLVSDLSSLGEEESANNGVQFRLKDKMEILGEKIEIIRVRKRDIHRHEPGCCDVKYNYDDYIELRKIALDKGLDIISRKGYEMIELSTFDINTCVYIVRDLK